MGGYNLADLNNSKGLEASENHYSGIIKNRAGLFGKEGL